MDRKIFRYVINLEERRDRRTEMEDQLRRVGWAAQFQHAQRPTSAGGFSSIGAHGCFLSHLATLKRGMNTNGHILIMEDDLNFVPGFSRIWDEAYKELERKDWSIYYPAHYLGDTSDRGLSLLDPSRSVMCAHFLMINREVVSFVIAQLENMLLRPVGHPLGGPMHVDGAYSTIREQNPSLNTFIFSPSMGIQRSSRSDIRDPNFVDRFEFVRPTLTKLRRLFS
jgi:glycosyl transferase, family 25